MRVNELFIAGIGCHLPDMVDVGPAVADGRYDAAEQRENDYLSVTISTTEAPPQMAVRAGRLAMASAAVPAADIALVLHASVWFQGIEYWPTASYVQHQVLGECRGAPALDVAQMCGGALGAMELAASYLVADPTRPAALITTADRLGGPGFDRWRSDISGIVYGDGAAAVVLARSGFARLRAIRTVTDSGLEGMYRGDEPFRDSPGLPVDVRTRRAAFSARTGPLGARIDAGMAEAVRLTLDDAGVTLDDVDRLVFPNVGRWVLENRYLAPLGRSVADTAWQWGRRTGHVGAADQLTGLGHLLDTGQLNAGGLVMLIGIGAGFSWTCAIAELIQPPPQS